MEIMKGRDDKKPSVSISSVRYSIEYLALLNKVPTSHENELLIFQVRKVMKLNVDRENGLIKASDALLLCKNGQCCNSKIIVDMSVL